MNHLASKFLKLLGINIQLGVYLLVQWLNQCPKNLRPDSIKEVQLTNTANKEPRSFLLRLSVKLQFFGHLVSAVPLSVCRYYGVKEFVPKHSIRILNDLNTLLADGKPIFPTHKTKTVDRVKLTRHLLNQVSQCTSNWSRRKSKNMEEVDLKSVEKIMSQMQIQISAWFLTIENDKSYRASNLLQKLIPSKLDLDHAVISLLVWSCIDDSLRSLHAKINRIVKHDPRKSATAIQEVARSLFEIDACLFPSLLDFPPSSDSALPAMSLAFNQLSWRNTQVSKDFLAGTWPHRELALKYSKTSSPYRSFAIIMLRELLVNSGDDVKTATIKIQSLYQNLGTGMNVAKYATKSLHDEIELPDPALIWKKYSIFLLALEIAPII